MTCSALDLVSRETSLCRVRLPYEPTEVTGSLTLFLSTSSQQQNKVETVLHEILKSKGLPKTPPVYHDSEAS